MSYLLEKKRKKKPAKASRKKLKAVPRKVIVTAAPETRQSLIGKLAFVVGLMGMFLLTLQMLLKAQAHDLIGEWAIEARWMRWISMAELQTGIFGTLLALLAFVFSTRRKATAILGFLFSLTVLVAWFVLENYAIRRL
jgi:hypothetical protein